MVAAGAAGSQHGDVLRALRSPHVLWAGVVAPILFIAVWLIAGATRPGYDPVRMPVSLLSLGPGGWVMVITFLGTGLLLVAFAIALGARLGEGVGSRGGPAGIATAGVGLVVAGLFSTQPLLGYPPGSPEGFATDVTVASVIHVLGACLFFFGLIAAALAMARRFRRGGAGGWAAGSVAVAAIVFLAFGASGGGPSGELLVPAAAGLLQRVAIVVGLAWVAAIAVGSVRGPDRALSEA